MNFVFEHQKKLWPHLFFDGFSPSDVILFLGGVVHYFKIFFSLDTKCVHILLRFWYVAGVNFLLKGSVRKNNYENNLVLAVQDFCGAELKQLYRNLEKYCLYSTVFYDIY